ncbi:RAMP superfamily CRISPR-associated protein [Niveispirillum sp.]|uniref:RAMP superfamily CRISPR-associated protein n=1 Tax=Niveispirillum sp. TaxID=1917217 RepID=UPI001B5D8D42|nr:RAMP superfamily CRISPR-associated protein [Niveispirillum sp.]MBP7339268.1 hypothetical protein [Niveispirillum sp.]
MTHRHELTLSVTLRSPFILPGLDVAGLGIDTPALRDEAGQPLIPADQVKGLLRAAMVSLVTVGAAKREELDALFGRASPDAAGGVTASNAPERGCLITADLVAGLSPSTDPHSITRIKIDEATGAVQHGALQVVELAAPVGTDVLFTGTAILRCPPQRLERLAGLLARAWALVPAIGGAKSAGFGRVIKAAVTVATSAPLWPAVVADAEGDSLWLEVSFDRRLLVDAERLSDNVWRGSTIVPGSAIKGALARALEMAGQQPEVAGSPLGQVLSTIRIGHAFPVKDDPEKRNKTLCDLPLPQSLVQLEQGDGTILDALLVPPAHIPIGRNGAVPAYVGDWKNRARPDHLPPSAIPTLPRIHTRIGEDYTAADGDLYVDIGLSPWQDANAKKRRHWRLRVDRNGADPDWFARIIALLRGTGLDGVGTTGASAQFRNAAPPPGLDIRPVSTQDGDLWAVTLVTSALMLPGNVGDIVHAAYQEFWRQALEQPGLILRNLFVRHRLAGGYIGMRRRHYGPSVYRPFLLTEPGSVFLLQGELGAALERRLGTGLPARGANGGWATDWRACPFLPENGFGDFRLNLVDHAALGQDMHGIARVEDMDV